MKVLQINSVYGKGSTGIICRSIAEHLAQQGDSCLTLYGRNRINALLPNSHYIGNSVDFLFHVVMTRLFDRCGLHSIEQTKAYIKAIKSYNPDVVHLHNIHGYFLNYPRLFKYLSELGKPIVWTLHDCWAFTGHCPYFTKEGCNRWKTGCYDCPERANYPKSWFLDRSVKNYIAKKKYFNLPKNITLVTPSQWLASLTRESFLSSYPVKVIPNGILIPKPNLNREKEVLNLIKTFPKQKPNIFLAVAAHWDERKNIADVMAVARAFKGCANTIVVGQLKGELKKDPFPDYVKHIPKTADRDYLFALYRCAGIFVNPTLEDNYPTVNLEAVAAGTPVFTYPTGGSPETVREYGGVTRSSSVKELISLIEAYLSGSFKLPESKPSLSYLGQETMADQYLKLYKNLDCEQDGSDY